VGVLITEKIRLALHASVFGFPDRIGRTNHFISAGYKLRSLGVTP
jgi:hypothetical protein